MIKTKIICTLGPSTDDPSVLESLMKGSMNVARLNFSHGTYEDHQKRIDMFVKIRKEVDRPVAMLLDTRGPEIRLGTFKGGYCDLENGQEFIFTTSAVEGSSKKASITYKGLVNDISVGDVIMIDDGLIDCIVKRIDKNDIICEVINGGRVSDKKSLNIPGVSIKMPYINEKDKEDLIFGIKNNFDFVAASFARSAGDIIEIRKILEENGGKDIRIIAKIENREGVDNIDEILKSCDGVMVARGDMGVEIPLEELPGIQKMLIKKTSMAGKVVITATQMLDSMIRNPRPTRAEVTDVANAIYDGTSALMLSGETAVGKFPVESLETMTKIACKTENAINYKGRFSSTNFVIAPTTTNAISHATCTTAQDLGAAAIITVTKSGHTARMTSRFRPYCPIIATTLTEKVQRQLSLSWGVFPILAEEKRTTDDLFDHAVDKAMDNGYLKNGDLVVITAGIPVGVSGNTNILKVHLVGHVLAQGNGVNGKVGVGNLCVAQTEEEARMNFSPGDILVMVKTSNSIIDLMKTAGGIITEEDGVSSHGAIVGVTLGIPMITGAMNATTLLKSGTIITMDGGSGLIYSGIVNIA